MINAWTLKNSCRGIIRVECVFIVLLLEPFLSRRCSFHTLFHKFRKTHRAIPRTCLNNTQLETNSNMFNGVHSHIFPKAHNALSETTVLFKREKTLCRAAPESGLKRDPKRLSGTSPSSLSLAGCVQTVLVCCC